MLQMVEHPRLRELGLALGPAVSREQIIARATSWLRSPVPYGQKGYFSNEYGVYRTDCSGYVSMAWALKGWAPRYRGGLDTAGLAAISTPISKQELWPGDVLIRTNGTNLTRHVVIFSAWTDRTCSAYWGFEQAGGVGTTYRVINYPYENSDGSYYQPYRYINLTD